MGKGGGTKKLFLYFFSFFNLLYILNSPINKIIIYRNGNKINGNIANRKAPNIPPSNTYIKTKKRVNTKEKPKLPKIGIKKILNVFILYITRMIAVINF